MKLVTICLSGLTCFALVACIHVEESNSIPATALKPMQATAKVKQLPEPKPLFVGDSAPSLTVDNWVKGDAIGDFEDGQVYVVEFWATWCGPCVSSMPHLSGIQDEYGDTVKVIGISSEPKLTTITSFLSKTNSRDKKLNNDRMRYTVAHDPDRTTDNSFMKAAKNGIPTAFIINRDGKVAWIGHPMNMDEPLAAVVKGKWDLATAAADFKGDKDSIPAAKLIPAIPDAKVAAVKPAALKPLFIGEAAPSIDVNRWVKGSAIKGFEKGKVYVLDFWATWCGPCIASIPHLNETQEKYANEGVQVIGCAIWQREDSQAGREENVSTFVKKQGDKMGYTIAVDNENWMSEHWMKPAGRRGIPSAFIVNREGKIAWIGHPSSLDRPLKEIVDGTWDLAAAADAAKKEAAAEKAMGSMQMEFGEAASKEDWNTCIAVIDAFITEYGRTARLDAMKFDTLLSRKKDKVAAYAWAKTMLSTSWDDPQVLNGFAWNIVDRTPAELQDLDFALKVALRANELSEGKAADILDTLARTYWERGETYKAIAWQEKAVENASDDQMGDSIRATLETYNATLANVDTDAD